MLESWYAMVVAGVFAAIAVSSAISAGLPWARRRLPDEPNQRSLHSVATPRGGGLPIAVLVVVCELVLLLTTSRREFGFLAVGSLAIAAVSMLDDLRGVRPVYRLGIQLAASSCLVAGIGGFREIHAPLVGSLWLGESVGSLLAVFWVAGLTNAYNFMDGIDGLAATQGLIGCVAWAIAFATVGDFEVGLIMVLAAGGALGFGLFNWAPAKVFMGDVGSTHFGFLLAAAPLLYSNAKTSATPVAPVIGLLVVWPFVLDASITFVRRLVNREGVFRAHRTHFYQRLVLAGWSHRKVCSVYTVAGGLTGVVLGLGVDRGLPVEVALAVIGMLGAILVSQVKALEKHEIAVKQGEAR